MRRLRDMILIKGLEGLKRQFKDPVLTIGNFDGVHIGHQKIIKKVVEEAKKYSGTSVAMTFEPHPIKVLYPERGIRTITTLEEKSRLMSIYGIDALIVVDFNREFASIHPEDFIKKILVDGIGVREVIVGHNYSFGKGRRGTTELLRRRGKRYGYSLHVVRNATLYGDVVSSSRIRSLILRGRVCEASLFLGRPYMINGLVIKGQGRGAKLLNTPTANIASSNELIPKEGVYVVRVRLGGTLHWGVANIGRNPTFSPNNPLSYEVHILDFSEDILGRHLDLFFIDRIRDEKVFSDKDSLKEQIRKDILKAKEIISKKKPLPIL